MSGRRRGGGAGSAGAGKGKGQRRPSSRGARQKAPRGVREIAAELVALGSTGTAVDRSLNRMASDLSPADRALLFQITVGAVRWLRRLDEAIVVASRRPVAKIDPALLPILRVAAYQLLYLERVPDYAIVDEAVRSARRRSHKGGVGFVNAVLRKLATRRELDLWPVQADQPIERLAIEQSFPTAVVERWTRRFGERRVPQLLADCNRPKPLHLLAFDRSGSDGGRQELAERLKQEGVATVASGLSDTGLVVTSGAPFDGESFRRGEFYVQDEVAQLAARTPAPVAGETVFDAVCGPGGKAFALLATCPDLELVGADASAGALARYRANCARLGVPVRAVAMDGRRPAIGRTFDRVIADLPCSGTGTLRKHPEIKWRETTCEPQRLAPLAGEILTGLSQLVAPRGRLVMITCSLESEENEAVVDRFLAEHPDWSSESSPLPDSPDALELPAGGWRMLPAQDHDGFSLQILRR